MSDLRNIRNIVNGKNTQSRKRIEESNEDLRNIAYEAAAKKYAEARERRDNDVLDFDWHSQQYGWNNTSQPYSSENAVQRQQYRTKIGSRLDEINERLKSATSFEETALKREQQKLTAQANIYDRSEQGVKDRLYEFTKKSDFGKLSSQRPEIPSAETLKNQWDAHAATDWRVTLKNPGAPAEYNYVPDKLGVYMQGGGAKGYNDAAVYAADASGNNYVNQKWLSVMQEGTEKRWDLLDDSEKQMYYYLLNSGQQESAYKYLDDMATTLKRRELDNFTQTYDKVDRDGDGEYESSLLRKVAWNAASVPLNMAGGAMAFADDAVRTVTGQGVDPYNSYHSMQNAAAAVRGDTAQDIDSFFGNAKLPVLGFGAGDAYQAVMSGLDSMVGGLTFGKGYEFLMSSSAASSKARELYDAGATNEEIALGAVASGVTEYLTERLPFEKWLKNNKPFTGGIKEVVKRALSQGVSEMGEEGVSEIANYFVDNWIRGANSDWEKLVEENDGDEIKALLQASKSVANAGLGGFVSGGTMALGGGGIKTGMYNLSMTHYGKQLANSGAYKSIENYANDNNLGYAGEKAYDRAKGVIDKLRDSEGKYKPTRQERNALGKTASAISQQKFDITAKSEIKSIIESKGMTASDPLIDAVYNLVQDEDTKFSGKEGRALAKEASPIAKEIRKNKNFRNDVIRRQTAERLGVKQDLDERVSDTGSAVNKATGKEVTINRIESIEDKTVVLSDGTTAPISEVEYKDHNQALVYESVMNLDCSKETANAIIAGAAAITDTNKMSQYLMGATEAYHYGLIGMNTANVSQDGFFAGLTESQQKYLYDLGRQDAANNTNTRVTDAQGNIVDGVKNKGKIVFHGDVAYQSMTDRQKASVSAIASVVSTTTHNQVHIYKSAVNADGVRVITDAEVAKVAGLRVGVDGAPNGFYDAKTGDIYIDAEAGINGDGLMLYTAAHEFTHFMRANDAKSFKRLADFLVNNYHAGVTVDDRVNDQIKKAASKGRTLSYDEAFEEFVADSMETMFTDGKLNERLAKLKAQDKGLWNKLKKFISDLAKRISDAYKGASPDSFEGQQLLKMKQSIDHIADLFAEGLASAGESYQKTDLGKLAEKTKTEYLERNDILHHERFIEPHMDMLKQQYSEENAAVSLEEIEKRYQKIIDIWKEIGGELNSKFLEDWNNQEYKDRAFNVFKAQQGYKYNAELSTMCKKGIPLFEAIDQIVKKEVTKRLNTDVIGKAEKQILYDILKTKGFDIPCAVCYVEQARQREGMIINDFLKGKVETNSKGQVTKNKIGWNQVFDMVEEKMRDMGVDYKFPNVDRSIATDKYSPAALTMDEETQEAFYNALRQVTNEEIERDNQDPKKKKKKPLLTGTDPSDVNAVLKGSLSSNLAMCKLLFTDPNVRFRIGSDLLYSSMTTKNLATAHSGLYKLFNMQGGVNGYKTKQGTAVYLGDILKKKWTPDQTRKEGGIRNQSNSDFMMYTLLDQAQVYVDLSAKGYYLHAYTKVLAELKLFGLSNAKINASLIPLVHVYRDANGKVDWAKTMENAGLDENGEPIYDDIEGINHKEAFMLLTDPEYSKSISGICIGYSDKHIAKLLDDPRVQLIIGFHDKTNDPNKRYKGARYAKNYNLLNEATVTKADGTVTAKHLGFNQFVMRAEKKFQKNADGVFEGIAKYKGRTYSADDIPRLATDLYLEFCEKKGYTPAYHIEIGKDADGNPIYMSDHPNYYKLMGDFGLKNSEGHYAPHSQVTFNMPDQVPYLDAKTGEKKYMSTKDYIKQELEKELKVRDDIAAAMSDESDEGIIPQFVKQVNELNAEKPAVKLSDRASAFVNDRSAAKLWDKDGLALFNASMNLYKKYQRGVANKDNFFVNTIAEFSKVKKRPGRKPDYVSHTRDGKVSSEYWYSDDGVIRGSAHWGLGIRSCDWKLDGVRLGSADKPVQTSKLYGFCAWEDFVYKTEVVGLKKDSSGLYKDTSDAELTSFDNPDGSNDIRYSVRTSVDGKKFVQIDEDAIDFNNGRSVASNLAYIVQSKFKNLIEANGQFIRINASTNKEFIGGGWSRELSKKDPVMYKDKLRTIANADEIIKAANGWINEDRKHDRKDKFTSFGRATVLLKVGDRGYEADVLVGLKDDGSATLHELADIRPKKIDAIDHGKRNKSLSSGEASARNYSTTDSVDSQQKNAGSIKNSDRDSEYMELAKDPSRNRDALSVIVDHAAEDWGAIMGKNGSRPKMLFHGTGAFGFTQFDMNTQTHSNGMIYATTDRTVAANYGGRDHYAFARDIGKKYVPNATRTQDIIQNAKYVLGADYHLVGEEERKGIWKDYVDQAAEIANRLDNAYETIEWMDDDMSNKYSCMIDMFYTIRDGSNPLDMDPDSNEMEWYTNDLRQDIEWYEKYHEEVRSAFIEHRNEFSNRGEGSLYQLIVGYDLSDAAIDIAGTYWNSLQDGDLLATDKGYAVLPSVVQNSVEATHEIGAYRLYGNVGSNPLVIDANGRNWTNVVSDIMDDPDDETRRYGHSTDAIAKKAKELGYTSVEFKNVYDGGNMATEYVFFDNTQVKSADPVTYDDNGNVIPLSKRFNAGSNDIRYSDRYSEGLDTRSLLAHALEQTLQSKQEKNLLDEYKSEIDAINAEQRKLADLKKQINSMMTSRETRDASYKERLRNLREEATKTANRINTHDKKLLRLESTKTLAAVVEREKEKAIKNLVEENKENLKAYRAAQEKKQQAIIDSFNERNRRARENRGKTEIRNKIKKLVGEFNSREFNPKENKYIPVELKKAVGEILGMIDLDSGRSEKMSAKLSELKMKYDALKNDPRYDVVYDSLISDMIQILNQNVGDTNIYRMNTEQLELTHNTLKALMYTVKNAVKVKNIDTEKNLFEISMDMKTESEAAARDKSGLATKWLTTQLRPETAFKRFGGFKKDSMWNKVYRMLDDGQIRMYDVQRRANEIFSDTFEDTKYLESLSDTKNMLDIGLRDEDDNAIRVTRGMALSMYMHLQNEQNARHFAFGGITVPNAKMYYKGDADAFGHGRTMVHGVSLDAAEIRHQIHDAEKRLSEAEFNQDGALIMEINNEIQQLNDSLEEIVNAGHEYSDRIKANIEKLLSDKDKAFLEEARELFDGLSKDELNKATMELYGFEKAQVKGYYPIHTDPKFRSAQWEQISKDMNLENSGFMKDRIENASNPIMLEDISEVINDQINKVSRYVGMTLPVKQFGKIWSKMQPGYKGSLQDSFAKSFGSTGEKYVQNLMSDIVGSRMSESTFLDRARGYMAGATLSLNPRVALAQAASYPTAAAEIGAKPLIKAAGKLLGKADRELIAQYTPMLYIRGKGNFDPDISNVKHMGQMHDKIMRKTQFLMGWIEAMDNRTVGALWYASQYYVDDHYQDLRKGTDDYYKQVAEVFNRVIERTQPNYNVLQRPDILRSPNALVKQLTMFMTQRLQNFNIVYDAAGTYSKYRYDLAHGLNGVTKQDLNEARGQFATAVISQAIAAAVIVGIKFGVDALLHNMNAYRDDDKELTEESVGLSLLDQFLNSIISNVLGGSELYEFAQSFLTGEKYYGVSVTGVDAFTDAADALLKLKEKPNLGNFNKLAKSVCTFLGIPLQNAEKIALALKYHYEDLANGELGSFEAGVTRTPKQEVKSVYEAYVSGDTAAISRLRQNYDTESKWNTEVKKALAENDPRIEEAARKRTAGDIAGYTALAKEIIAEKHFTQDDVVRAVNYMQNELSDAAPSEEKEPDRKSLYTNSDMEAALENGDSSTLDEIRSDLVDTKVANGTEESSAEKTVNSRLKSLIKERVEDGRFTVDQGSKYLQLELKMSAQEADQLAEKWKYDATHEGSISEARVGAYHEDAEPYGISLETYGDIIQKYNKTKGIDYDGDGKSDPYSKVDQIIEYINKFNLTAEQKDQMLASCGYSINKYWNRVPWH